MILYLLFQLELLVKFAAYVPEMHMSQIEVLYFYNTNLAFKQSANKFENMSKVFSHIKVKCCGVHINTTCQKPFSCCHGGGDEEKIQ